MSDMNKIIGIAKKINGVENVIEQLKPIIKQIESSPANCKGHYDRYMIILNKFPTRQKEMAAVLILAGANKYGVESALSLLNL